MGTMKGRTVHSLRSHEVPPRHTADTRPQVGCDPDPGQEAGPPTGLGSRAQHTLELREEMHRQLQVPHVQ